MQALGMIEVYGYLTAVEALDSALKAANVSRLGVEKVRGGLVTVLVEGDVGAVKAAMDASAAAAERVGTVISVHVIPRPADDVTRMLKGGKEPEEPTPPEPEKPSEPPHLRPIRSLFIGISIRLSFEAILYSSLRSFIPSSNSSSTF